MQFRVSVHLFALLTLAAVTVHVVTGVPAARGKGITLKNWSSSEKSRLCHPNDHCQVMMVSQHPIQWQIEYLIIPLWCRCSRKERCVASHYDRHQIAQFYKCVPVTELESDEGKKIYFDDFDVPD